MRYCTRADVHVDPEAEFVFVHCTVETIVQRHGLTDPVLLRLARIVPGADITADADETLESAGVALLFRGLRRICASDDEAIARGCLIFDALYAALEGGAE